MWNTVACTIVIETSAKSGTNWKAHNSSYILDIFSKIFGNQGELERIEPLKIFIEARV